MRPRGSVRVKKRPNLIREAETISDYRLVMVSLEKNSPRIGEAQFLFVLRGGHVRLCVASEFIYLFYGNKNKKSFFFAITADKVRYERT